MAFNPEELLSVDRIVDLESTDKDAVLDQLIDVLATSPLVTSKVDLKDKIYERERSVSTGVGSGMAIPHVKISTIRNFVMAVGRSQKGFDFKSLDGAPTHIVVMIGCNTTQAQDFLKLLARVVSRLKHPAVQKRILDAKTPEEIRNIFIQPEGVLV